jgi:hypothetical protein
MATKRLIILALMGMAIVYSGCKREESWIWQPKISAPVGNVHITLQKLLGDTLVGVNGNGGLSITLNQTLQTISSPDLIRIPDTSIAKTYNIPFISITLNPGNQLVSQGDNIVFKSEAKLTRVLLDKGQLRYKIRNQVDHSIDVVYALPGAKRGGLGFELTGTVPGRSINADGFLSGSIDLSGYELDLRGPGLNGCNTLWATLLATITNTGGSVLVTPQDSLVIEMSFENMVPYYAKGYFGQTIIDQNQETSLDVFKIIRSGSIEWSDAQLDLELINPMGSDFQVTLSNLKANNTKTGEEIALVHPMIGAPIQITRAQEHPLEPKIKRYHFTQSNSNLLQLINTMPDRLRYTSKFELNPLGNISNGQDFVHTNDLPRINLKGVLPLRFSAQNLRLTDTLNLSPPQPGEQSKPLKGTLYLTYKNAFPFSIHLTGIALDDQGKALGPLFENISIPSGNGNGGEGVVTPSEGRIPIALTEQTLQWFYAGKKLIAEGILHTPQPPAFRSIDASAFLDLWLQADVKLELLAK